MFIKALGVLRGVFVTIILPLALLYPEKAKAGGTEFLLDNVYSGQRTPPANAGPWVSATFLDVSPGTVLLTVTNSGLGSGEFISGLYFNLNPSDNVDALCFNLVNSRGSFALPTISLGTDSFNAGGDRSYDIRLSFGTAKSSRFTANDAITYEITGVCDLVASDFSFRSSPGGGSGPFYAAAHVQGTPPNNGQSCWIEPSLGPISVPEASASSLLVLGLGCWLIRHRLRNRELRFAAGT